MDTMRGGGSAQVGAYAAHMSLKPNRRPVITARWFSKSLVLRPFSGVDLLLLYLYNYSTALSPW